MNQYTVSIDYTKFVFDEGEAALSFAEVASKHYTGKNPTVTIIIKEEEAEEDGR